MSLEKNTALIRCLNAISSGSKIRISLLILPGAFQAAAGQPFIPNFHLRRPRLLVPALLQACPASGYDAIGPQVVTRPAIHALLITVRALVFPRSPPPNRLHDVLAD